MDCAQQPDFYGLNEFLYQETDSEYEYEGEKELIFGAQNR